MTNKRLYEIMDRLGMVEDESEKRCCAEGEPYTTSAEDFENVTSKDLISAINFVDELTIYNDLETIKKLLVVIIMEKNSMKKEKYIYSNLKEGKKKYGKPYAIFHYRDYELGIWDDDPGQCLFTIWHDQEIGFGTFNSHYEGDCRYLIDKELDDIYRKDGVHVKWYEGGYSGYRDIVCEFRGRLVKVWLVDGIDPDLDAIISQAKEICARLEAQRLAARGAGDIKAGTYIDDLIRKGK